MREELPVLNDPGLIEPKRGAQPRNVFIAGFHRKQQRGRIAGKTDKEEGEGNDAEDGENRLKRPPNNEVDHGLAPEARIGRLSDRSRSPGKLSVFSPQSICGRSRNLSTVYMFDRLRLNGIADQPTEMARAAR